MNRTHRQVYQVDEVFVTPEKAMAIAAMHQIEMNKYCLTDIHYVIDLMGMDGPDLIAHYGKIYEEMNNDIE